MLFGKDLMMTWMVGFHKRGSPVSENIYTLFATTFHNTLTSPKIIKVSLLRQNGFILTVREDINSKKNVFFRALPEFFFWGGGLLVPEFFGPLF